MNRVFKIIFIWILLVFLNSIILSGGYYLFDLITFSAFHNLPRLPGEFEKTVMPSIIGLAIAPIGAHLIARIYQRVKTKDSNRMFKPALIATLSAIPLWLVGEFIFKSSAEDLMRPLPYLVMIPALSITAILASLVATPGLALIMFINYHGYQYLREA